MTNCPSLHAPATTAGGWWPTRSRCRVVGHAVDSLALYAYCRWREAQPRCRRAP